MGVAVAGGGEFYDLKAIASIGKHPNNCNKDLKKKLVPTPMAELVNLNLPLSANCLRGYSDVA